MYKTIVAEKHMSMLHYLGIMIVGLIFLVFIVIDRTCNPMIRYLYIFGFFIFAYWGYQDIDKTTEYVSKVEIRNHKLIIKYFNSVSEKYTDISINLNDIKKVTLDILFYPNGLYSHNDCTQKVCIYHNNTFTSFSVKPSIGEMSLRKWSFALRFLSIAKYLPNFEYSIDTNKSGSFIKSDIDYFYKNNKKYPYIALLTESLGLYFIIFMTIVFIVLFICILSIIIEKLNLSGIL